MTGLSREGRVRVVAALVAVQVFFGVHYLAAKLLLESVPPRAWAVLRVASAAAVLWGVVALRRPALPRRPADLARLAVYSLFGIVINQVCFVEGLHRTTPGHSSILMTSIPVGALLFGAALGRESLTAVKALSLAVSFCGVAIVIVWGGNAAPGWAAARGLLGADTRSGDVLTLVNALSYAFFLVISKRLLSRVDPLAATTLLMTFGAVGILAVGWPALADLSPAAVPPRVWALGAYIVVFPTVLAYLLMYWALARVESSLVALFIYLQPLIATSLSASLLGERIGPGFVMGGALIFLGVYLALRPDRPVRVRTGPDG